MHLNEYKYMRDHFWIVVVLYKITYYDFCHVLNTCLARAAMFLHQKYAMYVRSGTFVQWPLVFRAQTPQKFKPVAFSFNRI